MTVSEMMSRMSSREMTEWMEYERLEPFGEVRGDMRAGIIAATIANVNLAKGKPPLKPTDFMPKFWEDEEANEPKSLEEQIAMGKMLAAALGARDLRETTLVDQHGNVISSNVMRQRAERQQQLELERDRRRRGEAPPLTQSTPPGSVSGGPGRAGRVGGTGPAANMPVEPIEIIVTETARERLARLRAMREGDGNTNGNTDTEGSGA